MLGEFKDEHWFDRNGNPTGGVSYGTGFTISWQNGPLGTGENRKEPNGAFVETIIKAAVQRLEFYQEGKFACSENEMAIEHLELALNILNSRTLKRQKRGVEGTHEV